MLLNEVITFNYKSAQKTILSVKHNSPSILIGENDCGKTTTLNSVRLLLDSTYNVSLPNNKSDKNDLSHTTLSINQVNNFLDSLSLPELFETDTSENDARYIVCIGKFQVEEFDGADEEISNQLRWVINSAKLDSKGSKYFYKARVIDSSNGVSSIYYSCSSPDNSSLDSIYGMSQTQINSTMRVHNPDSNNLVNDNGEGPHSIYEKIRSILLSVSCSYKFVKLGDDAKQKKWKQDLSIFPEYAYLSWNESLEGITKAASIILSNSIEHEVKRAEKISGILRSKAQVKINEKLKALGIQNKVPSIQGISASVNFELKNQLTDLFVRKDNSENDVHIDNQGEGIKRQIWFALLRLQAEQVESEVNNKRYVWCFDEPETHLHPKAQREFIATLRALAMQNFQILVSTHSTVFVNASKLDEINTFSISQNYTSIGSSQTVEDIFETLGVLNSDFLFYNKFLVVEGQTEEALIPFLYNLYKNRTLREDNVQLINLKGCNNEALASSLLDNLIKGFSKLEDLAVYLFDADTGRSTNGSTFVIGKQDLEDSFPPHIWPNMVSQVYGETISVTEEEVINLIASIPDVVAGTNLPSNQKFAARLRSLLSHKLLSVGEVERISEWPSKSYEWGTLISGHMSSEDIPQPLKQAFDALS